METITLDQLRADIPQSLAQSAHNGTSFTPERRAEQEQDGYAQEMLGIWNDLTAFARNDVERAIVAEWFPRFRSIMAKLRKEYLVSRSNVVSWMIAGPSNFPSARMEKRSRWAHNKLEHLLAVKEKLLNRIRKQMRPEKLVIMSGDSDAVERLQAKIAGAEKMQEMMKTANKTVKKFFKDKPAGIRELESVGFTSEQAAKLFEPDCFGGYGFASFNLTNNNANIRRMKERLVSISRAKIQKPIEIEGHNARLEDSPPENRVRLFFPGKPDSGTRTRLKTSGFRWTPTLGCWQAYRNHGTLAIARQEAGIPTAVQTE